VIEREEKEEIPLFQHIIEISIIVLLISLSHSLTPLISIALS
jgi:hypothetical protein